MNLQTYFRRLITGFAVLLLAVTIIAAPAHAMIDDYTLDLSYSMFRNADLSTRDFSRTNFTGADLRRANLMGTDLSCSDLTDADLTYANLIQANLAGANLRGANLTGAKISNATFGTGIGLSDIVKQELAERGGIFFDEDT